MTLKEAITDNNNKEMKTNDNATGDWTKKWRRDEVLLIQNNDRRRKHSELDSLDLIR